jgi:hypothetical protein
MAATTPTHHDARSRNTHALRQRQPQHPCATTMAATTPTRCNNGSHNTHVPQQWQPQHPRAVMMAATTPTCRDDSAPVTPHATPMRHDASSHNTYAPRRQHPQHHTRCDGSNCKTKHGTACFGLIGIICACRLA